MSIKLTLPEDFEDYAWEVEAKGVFWDTSTRIGDREVTVTFYDPVRLSQDIEEDLREHRVMELNRVLVIPRVTKQHMLEAADQASPEFFL